MNWSAKEDLRWKSPRALVLRSFGVCFESRRGHMQVDSPSTGSEAESGPHRKALEINLDPTNYGTFAEIGAGQEVADWFLRVGGASGTVAQTICAYDKAFSDERYGPGTRYVSRERLLAMLDREYQTVEKQLRDLRGPEVRFFAFADTVATRSFKGDNEQHGWVGLRFQATSRAAPSDILLHVALRDREVEQQRSALGVLGVNLVHAAFRLKAEPGPFLGGLFEGLTTDRLEIDVIQLDGPAFAGQDARLWCLGALRQRMALAVMFDASGRPEQPSSLLRKRSVVFEGPILGAEEIGSRALVSAAFAQLGQEERLDREPLLLLDVRAADLTGSGADPASVLARLGKLTARAPVVLSDQSLLHPLVEYLRRYASGPIRLVTSSSTFAAVLSGSYETLPGTLLESLGKLLVENLRLYIYPVPLEAFLEARGRVPFNRVGTSVSGGTVSLDDLRCEPPLDHLLRYLRGAGWLLPLRLS